MVRVFLWMAELGTLFVVASLAFVLLCMLGRSAIGVLRAAANMVLGGAISGAVGLAAGIFTALGGGGDAIGGGLLATIVTLPLALWLLDRLGRRGAGRGERDFARSARSPEPGADALVAGAWVRATRLAPGHRNRIEASRAACAYVLHMAEANPFDMDAMECAVLIRRRLPELIEQTDGYCRLAARPERRDAVDGMVGDLERIGRMAASRVERAKAQLGDSLSATRAHIANRTNEQPAL